MAKLGINTGTSPDAGDGDALLIGAIKINSNFNEVYNLLGDGTNLTTGIVTSIVAGTNVTISGSTGQVTINANSSGGTSSQWVTTAAGIHTTSNVGIGTTNATSKLTVKGNTSLETLNVSGVSTFIGDINVVGLTTLGNALDVIGQSLFRDTTAVFTPGTLAVFTVGQNIDGSNEDHFGIYYADSGTPGVGGQAILFTSNGDIRIDVNDQTSNIIFGDSINDFLTINASTSVSTFTGSARVGVDTSSGVILTSPNGTQYQLFVENDGTLKTVAV